MTDPHRPSTPAHPTFTQTIHAEPHVLSPTLAPTPTHRPPGQPGETSHTQPSPILTSRPTANPVPPIQPQYAETLTPLKLRRRRRHAPLSTAGPSIVPLVPGPSNVGFLTEEGEVYRGASYDPRSGRPPAMDEDALTLGGSSTTSSSSSWSWASDIQRGRRATMAVFERFGERLGVRRGSTSSADTSETGTTRSVSVSRRRSRRLSRTTTKDSMASERPKRHHLPRRREFTLLLPPKHPSPQGISSRMPTPKGSMDSGAPPPDYHSERLISTPSLPVVLDHIRALRLAAGVSPEPPSLDVPVRRAGSAPGRSRPRLKQKVHSFPNPPVPRPIIPQSKSRLDSLRGTANVPRPKSVSDLMGMVNPYESSANLNTLKGHSGDSSPVSVKEDAGGCWWLDVSCPSWEDSRDIGESLGSHPLTSEDVLQQDPREKFDVFERSGYYFVVVRALDEEYFKYTPATAATTSVGSGEKAYIESSATSSPQSRANNEKKKEGRRRGWGMGRTSGKTTNKEGEKVEIVEDNPGKEGSEGLGVGAVNVYLVVFADGIVSFHFDDISKHTKRVSDRVLSDTSVQVAPKADWIAHGLLDSIVDAFFPLVRFVDGEVDDIDSLTVDPSSDPRAVTLNVPPVDPPEGLESVEKGVSAPPVTRPKRPLREWIHSLTPARFALPNIRLPHYFIYIRLFVSPTSSAVRRRYEHPDNQVMPRASMVRHMTQTRKSVTGSTRLLGTKHQVVGLMRKRVAEHGEGVEEYMGDVEDHISSSQNSSNHYEYILSHCQPAYSSHLNLGFKISKGRSDRAILASSTVAIGISPMQLVTSSFGTNVKPPHNGDPDNWHDHTDGTKAPLNWFAGILAFLILVSCCIATTVRWWRWSARVKWTKRRGEPLPSTWDGFWGFR